MPRVSWKSPGSQQESSYAYSHVDRPPSSWGAPDKISFYDTETAPHVKVQMETRLTAVEQSRLDDLYDLIDGDGDDLLTKAEIRAVHAGDSDGFFEELDTNADGEVPLAGE